MAFARNNNDYLFVQEEDDWEDYSTSDDLEITLNGEPTPVKNYSQIFFDRYPLGIHLNIDCNRMLQLGASRGHFLESYQSKGWDVLGYDYAHSAVEYMQSQSLPCKLVNLNSVTVDKTALACQKELNDDLALPANIIAVRLFQYLSPGAARLLMFGLMDTAAPGSVFVIIGSVYDDHANRVYGQENPNRTPNYFASYFGARTNMITLFHQRSDQKNNTLQAHTGAFDEMLVVKKCG